MHGFYTWDGDTLAGCRGRAELGALRWLLVGRRRRCCRCFFRLCRRVAKGPLTSIQKRGGESRTPARTHSQRAGTFRAEKEGGSCRHRKALLLNQRVDNSNWLESTNYKVDQHRAAAVSVRTHFHFLVSAFWLLLLCRAAVPWSVDGGGWRASRRARSSRTSRRDRMTSIDGVCRMRHVT